MKAFFAVFLFLLVHLSSSFAGFGKLTPEDFVKPEAIKLIYKEIELLSFEQKHRWSQDIQLADQIDLVLEAFDEVIAESKTYPPIQNNSSSSESSLEETLKRLELLHHTLNSITSFTAARILSGENEGLHPVLKEYFDEIFKKIEKGQERAQENRECQNLTLEKLRGKSVEDLKKIVLNSNSPYFISARSVLEICRQKGAYEAAGVFHFSRLNTDQGTRSINDLKLNPELFGSRQDLSDFYDFYAATHHPTFKRKQALYDAVDGYLREHPENPKKTLGLTDDSYGTNVDALVLRILFEDLVEDIETSGRGYMDSVPTRIDSFIRHQSSELAGFIQSVKESFRAGKTVVTRVLGDGGHFVTLAVQSTGDIFIFNSLGRGIPFSGHEMLDRADKQFLQEELNYSDIRDRYGRVIMFSFPREHGLGIQTSETNDCGIFSLITAYQIARYGDIRAIRGVVREFSKGNMIAFEQVRKITDPMIGQDFTDYSYNSDNFDPFMKLAREYAATRFDAMTVSNSRNLDPQIKTACHLEYKNNVFENIPKIHSSQLKP